MYQRVLLVVNTDSIHARNNADRTINVLSSMGVFCTRIDETSRQGLKAYLSNSPDLREILNTQSCLLVVMADAGVLLNCVSILGNSIKGIAGTYSTEHQPDMLLDYPFHEFMSNLPEVLMGLTPSDERNFAIAEIGDESGNPPLQVPFASELVISNGTLESEFEIAISFGRYGIASFKLNTFAVALPTGTTRYTMALGGPIVSPALESWTCVPCGRKPLSLRPFLLPQLEPLSVKVRSKDKLFILTDGQERIAIPEEAELIIRKNKQAVRFLHPQSWNYFSDLRDLLDWQRLPV